MKQVDEMPTSGQFVAVWETHKVWSDTLKYIDGALFSYVDNEEMDTDELFTKQVDEDFYIANNAKYFIVG